MAGGWAQISWFWMVGSQGQARTWLPPVSRPAVTVLPSGAVAPVTGRGWHAFFG
jgi:hypothetical protein